MCDLYLRWEDPNDHTIHYTTSETAGYLQHTDSNYRDPATNQETEAIEKISYDGTKVTLTIDAKYGQDEIEIDDSVGTELRFNENGLPPLSDVEHFIESLTGYSIEVINNMSTEIRVEKGKTILYITHNDLVYPDRTVYIINEIGSGVGRAVVYLNDGNHIIYDTFINGNFINTGLTVDGDLLRTPDPLPFVLSFTMSAIAWDKIMNTEVYNSWAVDRS
jgi:hypothetical protein